MSKTLRLFIMLCIGGFITWLYRQLPFLLFRKRKIPDVILYLGRVLPMAIMCILVIYTVKTTSFLSLTAWLPQIVSIAVVALLHLWKRNTTLSIFAGTACYMLLIRLL